MMFKTIRELTHVRDSKDWASKEIRIIFEYNPIECIDFKGNVTIIKKNYKEKTEVIELKPQLLNSYTTSRYKGEKSVQWYDIFSFGISWAARKAEIYDIYEIKTYLDLRTGNKYSRENYLRTEYR